MGILLRLVCVMLIGTTPATCAAAPDAANNAENSPVLMVAVGGSLGGLNGCESTLNRRYKKWEVEYCRLSAYFSSRSSVRYYIYIYGP